MLNLNNMLKNLKLLIVAVAALATATAAQAHEPEVVEPNYNLAEQFSPARVRRLVPQTSVRPNWFKDSNKFWYKWQTVDAITLDNGRACREGDARL